MFRTAFLAAALAISLAMSSAAASDYTVGNLKVSQPWARATPKGASVGGGYLKITNTGTAPDRLVGGTSDVSKNFEVHEMSMDNGVMKMRAMDKGVEIAPGQTVEFKPSGYHIMFVGLNKALEKGQRVKATLDFEKAGKVDVEFVIESIGAQSGTSDNAMPPGMHMNH
jgi:periplasmic copper chaperone A